MNLTKNNSTRVELDAKWFKDDLFITLTREDDDLGTSRFELVLDDIDLEHFIATLIEFQR